MEEILTPLSLLMPAFSLPKPPRLGYPAALQASERSPTARKTKKASHTRSFGN